MWYGEAAAVSSHLFLGPGYCRWNRPSNLFPRCESSFYLGPVIDHPRDSFRMWTRENKVLETKDVTWETPPVMVAPPVQLQQPVSPELLGAPSREGRPSRDGHRSWERRQSCEGWMISILVHPLHCHCWGGGSTISVERPPSASSDTPGGECGIWWRR